MKEGEKKQGMAGKCKRERKNLPAQDRQAGISAMRGPGRRWFCSAQCAQPQADMAFGSAASNSTGWVSLRLTLK